MDASSEGKSCFGQFKGGGGIVLGLGTVKNRGILGMKGRLTIQTGAFQRELEKPQPSLQGGGGLPGGGGEEKPQKRG